MKKSNIIIIKRIKKLFYLLYIVLIIYFIKFLCCESSTVIINPYNPRMANLEKNVVRGKILDRNNKILAYTDPKLSADLRYARVYPYNNLFCHVIGYSANTKTGIEAETNNFLLYHNNNLFHSIYESITKKMPTGLDVVTTLDLRLQKKAYALLGNNKGAVIIMEPTTGKILTMVSKPGYNPNKINKIWNKISKDKINNPLINRATQGLYPPGSTFKIITALTFIETGDWKNFKYKCAGTDIFDQDIINCYNHNKHGIVDLEKAFAKSCNTAFASIGVGINGEDFKNVCKRLYFNRNLNLIFPSEKSIFRINKQSKIREKAETAIGQGETLVTPIHMAMITSSVANGGMVYKPYLIDSIIDKNSKIVKKYKPEKFNDFMTLDEAQIIEKMMRKVITEGTGTKANIKGINIYGKTGTAENETKLPHSWFVGFSKTKKPDITVVVLVEHGGVSYDKAVPIARNIFECYYKFKK